MFKLAHKRLAFPSSFTEVQRMITTPSPRVTLEMKPFIGEEARSPLHFPVQTSRWGDLTVYKVYTIWLTWSLTEGLPYYGLTLGNPREPFPGHQLKKHNLIGNLLLMVKNHKTSPLLLSQTLAVLLTDSASLELRGGSETTLRQASRGLFKFLTEDQVGNLTKILFLLFVRLYFSCI